MTAAEIGRVLTACIFSCENSSPDAGIYCLMFKTSRKIYVGQSKNIPVRIKQHLSDLKSGTHKNKMVQNHYNKYGKNDLSVCVGKYCPEDKLDQLEISLISAFKSLSISLNSDGGGNKNKNLSSEHKRKLSEKAKMRPSPNLGRTASSEARKRMSESHIGHPSSRKGVKTGKPSWNSGLIGAQKSTRRLKISAVNKITGANLGTYDSISSFLCAMNYKSKNCIRLSDGTRGFGNYILSELPK